jgi:hypothetical protein
MFRHGQVQWGRVIDLSKHGTIEDVLPESKVEFGRGSLRIRKTLNFCQQDLLTFPIRAAPRKCINIDNPFLCSDMEGIANLPAFLFQGAHDLWVAVV